MLKTNVSCYRSSHYYNIYTRKVSDFSDRNTLSISGCCDIDENSLLGRCTKCRAYLSVAKIYAKAMEYTSDLDAVAKEKKHYCRINCENCKKPTFSFFDIDKAMQLNILYCLISDYFKISVNAELLWEIVKKHKKIGYGEKNQNSYFFDSLLDGCDKNKLWCFITNENMISQDDLLIFVKAHIKELYENHKRKLDMFAEHCHFEILEAIQNDYMNCFMDKEANEEYS